VQKQSQGEKDAIKDKQTQKKKKRQLSRTPNSRKPQQDQDELNIFHKLESELKHIEERGQLFKRDDTFDKKLSILTFAKNSEQSKGQLSEKKPKPQGNPLKEPPFADHTKNNRQARDAESKSPVSRQLDGMQLPRTETFNRALTSNSRTAAAASPIDEKTFFHSHFEPIESKDSPVTPMSSALNIRSSHRIPTNLKQSNGPAEPLKDNIFSSQLDQSGLRKSKQVAPIDPEKYRKLMKKSLSQSRAISRTQHEEREVAELRQKPLINPNSRNLYHKINSGNFDSVHERLFYKGIEALKKKEEKSQVEFDRSHPFRPQTGKQSPPPLVTRDHIDKLVYTYKEKEIIQARKKYVTDNFDPLDGKRLYSPRVTRSPGIKHAVPLKDLTEASQQNKQYLQELRQIFDFLDKGYEGFVYAQKIDYENIHPDLADLLQDILQAVAQANRKLSFADFHELIQKNKLERIVQGIFDCLLKQPLINPKKLKDQPFRFS